MKNNAVTYRRFYDLVLATVRNDPEWDESDLEYISYAYTGYEKMPIGTHHFDVTTETMYGTNEGIVCLINMIINRGCGEIERIHLAMFKTLNTSRAAYMEMGRLGALFSYCAMQIAEEHINEFEVQDGK